MEKIRIKTSLLITSYIIALAGFFSVNPYIDVSYAALFTVLFLVGVFFDYKNHYPVPRFVLNTISLSFVIYKFITVSIDDPIVPIIEALVFLLGVKLIENKKFRDYLQVYVISIFLLAGSALLSIDMIFMVYFLVLFFSVVIAIVLLAFYSEAPELAVNKKVLIKILITAFAIPVIAVPFSIILFVILPRTDYPLFSFLNHGIKASTGFSDSVKLGEVSDIQEDETVVMRVTMPQINSNFLYWRGIVLSYFDGKEWKRIENLEKDTYLNGQRVRQIVILEPYRDKYVFALDKPVKVKGILGLKVSDDFVYQKNLPVNRRVKYEAVSVLTNRIYVRGIEKELYLQLPEGIKEKLGDLARRLKKDTTIKTVYSILNFLKENYVYSLKELTVSQDPVTDFLLKNKKGNCEYFASAMAVLLRLNGIPARIVAGYKGGIYNEIGGYYIVPQKNAHVWVEAYVNESWLRIDPTPAPIESFVSVKTDIKSKVAFLLDTLEYYWINLVINFDFQKQITLFKKIKENIRKPNVNFSISREVIVKIVIIGFSLPFITLILYKLFVNMRASPEQKLLNRFYKKLSKIGYKKDNSDGLIEFVNKIENPDIKRKALLFAVYFDSIFYKDRKFTKNDIKKLEEILSEF